MTVAYLEKLNDQQRRAVEYGIGAPPENVASPLLIIAGAGSGKTNTLAHRERFPTPPPLFLRRVV